MTKNRPDTNISHSYFDPSSISHHVPIDEDRISSLSYSAVPGGVGEENLIEGQTVLKVTDGTWLSCVAASPVDSLVAYGAGERVFVLRYSWDQDGESDPVSSPPESLGTKLKFEQIASYFLGTVVQSLSWASSSNDSDSSSWLLAAACVDSVVRVISPRFDSVRELSGHQGLVLDVAFSLTPSETNLLATASDDCSVRLWMLSSENQQFYCSDVINLDSFAMSVKFHPDNARWLMVAESSGLVRILDIDTSEWILQLRSPTELAGKLQTADWCWADINKVGAIAGGQWMIWRHAAEITEVDACLPVECGDIPVYSSHISATHLSKNVMSTNCVFNWSPDGLFFVIVPVSAGARGQSCAALLVNTEHTYQSPLILQGDPLQNLCWSGANILFGCSSKELLYYVIDVQ